MKILCPYCKRAIKLEIQTTIQSSIAYKGGRGKGPVKLSPTDIKSIFTDHRLPKIIAEEFKVSQSMVSKIKRKGIHSELTKGLRR